MLKLLKIGVLVIVATGFIGMASSQAQSNMKNPTTPDHRHDHNGFINRPFNPYNYYNPLNPYNIYFNPYSPLNPNNLYNPYNPYYNALNAYNPYSPYSFYNPYQAVNLPPFVYRNPNLLAQALTFQNALSNNYANNYAAAWNNTAAVYNTMAYNNAVANNTAAYYNALAYNNAAMYNNAAANSSYSAMYNMYAANAAANNTAALYNAMANYNNTINNPYGMTPSSNAPSRYSSNFSGGPGGSNYNPYGNPGVVPSYAPSYSQNSPPAPGVVDTAPNISHRSGPDIYATVNTPNIIQEQSQAKSEKLKKYQRFSTPSDIVSGAALNALVDDMRTSLGKDVKLAPIPVSESVLKKINVVQKETNSALGILRDDGKFTWPVAFSDDVLTPEERKSLEDSAQKAVIKAFRNQIDNDLLRDMQTQIERARGRLVKKINDIRTMDYIDAKRFLYDLEDARQAIKDNEAQTHQQFQKFISGGKTVKEIADFMTANGLKFAPATLRDEAAYRALHSALVALDVAYNAQYPAQNPE